MSPTFVARSFNTIAAKECGIMNIDSGVLTLVRIGTQPVIRCDNSTIRAPFPTYNTITVVSSASVSG